MQSTCHYFSNAVGSVLFVPGSFVYLHWSGEPLGSAEFRALYVHAGNLLRHHHLNNILADHRAMPAAPAPADREWLLHQWLPTATAALTDAHYAVLPAASPARRLHTEDVLRDLRHHFRVQVFDDLEQAAGWLAAAPPAR